MTKLLMDLYTETNKDDHDTHEADSTISDPIMQIRGANIYYDSEVPIKSVSLHGRFIIVGNSELPNKVNLITGSCRLSHNGFQYNNEDISVFEVYGTSEFSSKELISLQKTFDFMWEALPSLV